jgi:hypothetical protein
MDLADHGVATDAELVANLPCRQSLIDQSLERLKLIVGPSHRAPRF